MTTVKVLNILNGIVKTPTADVLWGAAPIDWCEENLPETNILSIAEFHNSWTNIFYIISGLLLLRSHLRLHSDIRDPLFAFFIFNIIMTGVTSAWFHSTLLFLAQKSDEFFENAAMVSLLYYHVFPLGSSSKIIKYRGACCAVHTLLLGVGVLCIPDLFCEIHLITTVLITFKTGYTRSESLPPHTRSKALHLFKSSFASVGVAFFCWLLDFLLCDFFSPFYLHAFVWHLGTSISLYYGGEASLLISSHPSIGLILKGLQKSREFAAKNKTVDKNNITESAATLIVAPPGLIDQWKAEFEEKEKNSKSLKEKSY